MKTVISQTKRAFGAMIIATQLLSVSTAGAAQLDSSGNPISSHTSTPDSSAGSATPTARPRHAKARPRLPLGNGDATGIMDDDEKALYANKETKAEDADQIGQYTVTEDQLLYSGGGANARVIGVVRKDEVFAVTLPGERFSSVRLKNGQRGFVDKSKIVADGRGTTIKKELAPPASAPRPQTPPPRKSEAVCDTCGPNVDLPNAADRNQIGRITDINRHLNSRRSDTKTNPTEAFPANGRTSTKVARLISSARYQAVKSRVPARYLWGRLGSRPIGGNVSKGKCFAAVKDSLLQAGIFKSRPGTEAAKDAGHDLRRAGMTNVISSLRQTLGSDLRQLALQAPVGSVLVYEGGSHGYGHIEIKTAKQQYCSDFCQVTPVNIRNARRLIGIYTL